MLRLSHRALVMLVALAAFAPRCAAQEKTATPSAVHVLGLEGAQRNAKGKLTVEPGALRFDAGTAKAEVAIPTILDIFTADDSQRMIGGTLGTLTMFAPYGSGRFLSLFRKKVDLLIVEYRDANSALHGAIFRLPHGQALELKKQLLARGAHTSVPVEEEQPAKDTKKKGEKKQ